MKINIHEKKIQFFLMLRTKYLCFQNVEQRLPKIPNNFIIKKAVHINELPCNSI